MSYPGPARASQRDAIVYLRWYILSWHDRVIATAQRTAAQRATDMASLSTFNHGARRRDAPQSQDQRTRLTDRALGALEKWIEMRTRLEGARLDAVTLGGQVRTSETRPRAAWWRSWRACTRRRGFL
jgi:hypothetical protein